MHTDTASAGKAASTAAGLIRAIEDARSEVEASASVATRASEQAGEAVAMSATLDGEALARLLGDAYPLAPRGALAHWIDIEDKKIKNYQCVVPTTWNASPRDPAGKIGAYEAALLDTPMHDPNQPLEILRTIHSFDPCLACATHVLDMEGNEVTSVKVR